MDEKKLNERSGKKSVKSYLIISCEAVRFCLPQNNCGPVHRTATCHRFPYPCIMNAAADTLEADVNI